MSPLTQANRLIAIDTPLGPDVLLLRGFTGHESISRLFNFELDLLSTDSKINFEEIIGQKVTIRLRLGLVKERFFHGIISRFMQTGSDVGLANYRATMVPALWFLTRTADCRIFQNQKVPDIIQEIFKENGVTDIKTVLKTSYEPRDYCVQYRETDFNFVSRLMEQYGMFYFFEHEETKHTVVLSDDLSAHQPCPEQSKISWNPQGSDNLDEDVITSLQWEETFRFGKYAVTDYNFETPSTSLQAEVKTQIEVGGNSKYEIYDYPGEYGEKAEGDGIAKIRMEEEEAQYKVMSGNGTARVFTTGYKFTLQDYVRKDVNGAYVLTQVQHVASVGSTYTIGAAGGGAEGDYSNSFTCIPAKRPFRSPQVTPKPMVQGPQTAVVVGKSGEEIWTDKYGRVKVQFHWDRYGTMNESSSCWVRVSQVHAGKGFGAVDIPRIGEEVIVSFLEGDPDQPIIVGRVYNATNMPPNGLPKAGMTSGLKSNSTPGGGGNNCMMMDDTKGKEGLTIHAQYDMNTTVKHDANVTIETGNSTFTVKAGTHTEKIKGDTAVTVETGTFSHNVATGTADYKVKANLSIYSDAEILIEAANKITLHTGESKITLEKSGAITIHGKNISVIGDADIKESAPKIDISADGEAKFGVGNQNVACDKAATVISGAAINSSATGKHEITGAVVKIN